MKELTGEQVLTAYNEALRKDKDVRKLPTTMVPIRMWDALFPQERTMYGYMAEALNTMAQQEEGKP